MRQRLAYQYTGPGSFYALLGSCVRALGKGWTVRVLAQKHRAVFDSLRKMLVNPENMKIASSHRSSGMTDEIILNDTHVMVATEKTEDGDFDLISKFTRHCIHPNGITAFTGTGKGKTTGAIGMAMMEVLKGKKAAAIQWFKEKKGAPGTFSISEHLFPEKLRDPAVIEFHPTGLGFFGSPTLDRVKGEQAYQKHRARAESGIELARTKIVSGDYAVVVLDEFVDTVAAIAGNIPLDLIDPTRVQRFLSFCQKQPQTDIVVTGRRVTETWADFIGNLYTITEITHPWSSAGSGAVAGVDF